MLGLFKPKLPVDPDEFEWLMAGYAWLLQEFDGIEGLRGTALVLPNGDYFPDSRATGHARAVELFDQVRAIAGMSDWQCDLYEGATDADPHIARGHALRRLTAAQPLGTFGYANGRYHVTYNPAELARPQSLVATFAHELAHYLIHSARTRPPGGPELEEHATDLAAIFMGFGVFQVNSARDFQQFQSDGEQGWQMRSSGYLSELSRVTALAMFVRLAGADARAAEAALKDYLRGRFRKAIGALDHRHPQLAEEIAAVDLTEWR